MLYIVDMGAWRLIRRGIDKFLAECSGQVRFVVCRAFFA